MTGPFAQAAIAETRCLLSWLDAYPAVTPASFNVYWTAVDVEYDGAPDSHCIRGHGNTRYEAYAELAERRAEEVS